VLERVTGLRATIDAQPLPAADPPITFAVVEKAGRLLGWEPSMAVDEGLARFWDWYRAEILPTTSRT
jgi:UDP-glucuronate 4-epimerase